ncbi:MAG: hypothetical protein JWR34_7435 [Mycobacterium sp.]|nr:hypothetical protein [Mycobacterium sp.]
MGEMIREELSAMTDQELLAYEREHHGNVANTYSGSSRLPAVGWLHRKWSESVGTIAAGSLGVCLVLLTVVILQALALRDKYPVIVWGSVPEAFAAVGTVAALFVAGAAWRHDVRNRRKDEAARAEAEKRRQAEAISCWPDYYDAATGSHISMIGLINASEAVIYEVQVRVIHDQDQGPEFKSLLVNWVSHAYIPTLAPGTWEVEVFVTNEPTAVELYFRDQQGNTWRQDSRGKLEPSTEPFFPIPTLGEVSVRPPDPWPGVRWTRDRVRDYVHLQRPTARKMRGADGGRQRR